MYESRIIRVGMCLVLIFLVITITRAWKEEEYCTPNTECLFMYQVRDFFNRSIVYTDANCTITFYYDNGNIWKTENMTLIGRFYVYTLTPTEEGTYYYEINCVRPDGNYGGVAGVLYVKKSLYDKVDSIPEDVWDYSNRTLTYYPSYDYIRTVLKTDIELLKEMFECEYRPDSEICSKLNEIYKKVYEEPIQEEEERKTNYKRVGLSLVSIILYFALSVMLKW